MNVDVSPKVFKRKSKIIVLANDKTIDDYDCQFDKNFYFRTKLKPIIDESMHKLYFIDVSNVDTYKMFLTSLNEFTFDSDTFYEDVLNSFKFIQMSEMSDTFIQLKTKKKWRREIEKLIMNRYMNYKLNPANSSLSIVSQIRKELLEFVSPYDKEFIHEINSILFRIENKDDPNRNFISSELEITACKSFDNLNQFAEDFLNKKKIFIYRKSHIRLLEKDYFNIISYMVKCTIHNFDAGNKMWILDNQNEKNLFDFYYSRNIEILKEQIKKDCSRFLDAEREAKEKFGKYKLNQESDDFIKEITNYNIKQNEKYREQHLQIGIGGDLRSEMKQD